MNYNRVVTLALCGIFLLTGACKCNKNIATLTVNPSLGLSGITLNLTVRNVHPGTTVVFSEQGTVGLTITQADANGVATATFIPLGEPGHMVS